MKQVVAKAISYINHQAYMAFTTACCKNTRIRQISDSFPCMYRYNNQQYNLITPCSRVLLEKLIDTSHRQEILHFLWYLSVHSHVYKSQQLNIMPIRTCFRSVCYWNGGLNWTYMFAKHCSNVCRGFRLFVVKNLNKPGMYIFCKKCSSKISYVNSVLHI